MCFGLRLGVSALCMLFYIALSDPNFIPLKVGKQISSKSVCFEIKEGDKHCVVMFIAAQPFALTKVNLYKKGILLCML